jgi:hypothetical protein
MQRTLLAAAAAVAVLSASQASATIWAVDFQVGGNFVSNGLAPYGLTTDPTQVFHGVFTADDSSAIILDPSDPLSPAISTGSALTSLNFVVGTKTFTLADLNLIQQRIFYDVHGGPVSGFVLDLNFIPANFVIAGTALFPGNLALFNTIDFTSNRILSCEDCVTFQVARVPEPATWATMLLGFFGLGSILRRRKTTLVAA